MIHTLLSEQLLAVKEEDRLVGELIVGASAVGCK
jgi:hypothetical protein